MAAGDYSEKRLGRQQNFQLGTVSTGDLAKMGNLHALAQGNLYQAQGFHENRKSRGLPNDNATNDHAANRVVGQLAQHKASMKVTRKSEFHAASTLRPSLGKEILQ